MAGTKEKTPKARGGGGTAAGSAAGGKRPRPSVNGAVAGKHLVIVESPSKARSIGQYLGPEYVVRASIGHVRDLPSKAAKGSNQPVPGVDLENDFEPTYVILADKKEAMSELKRIAKTAADVWFATDLDREGEAIAWHLAQELGIESKDAKRVVFNAVTKAEIKRAFENPHPIDEARVNAQQARRILDRIVGYQVSPLLWKKVARGLSAGRVQSVAVRLIVEREREIRGFVPDEYWTIVGRFTPEMTKGANLAKSWAAFMAKMDAKGNAPTLKAQNSWMAHHHAFRADLVEIDGKKAEPATEKEAAAAAKRAGFQQTAREATVDEKGKGPAKNRVTLAGTTADVAYVIRGIETKRTTSKPPAPFITSTLQQAASTRLGFGAKRTMRQAQELYEGVDLPGRGTLGLITYMRTDSTHLSGEAISMVREYVGRQYGAKYLPDEPNRYTSSNKAAQEAHEAIRPTDVSIHPEEAAKAIKPDLAKLYRIIWERFVACQMVNAQWDATAITLSPKNDAGVVFRCTGRKIVFDGFYRVTGIPTSSDEQTLPAVEEGRAVATFGIDPMQKFTSPPPRYTEASLVKTLEEEGIGRPSTYADIIQKVQDRKYVEQRERRFFATDLGEVVTDKLVEAFPEILDVGFTREMEGELDRVEERELGWTEVLRHFYGPFRKSLEKAHENLSHAKAETQPAPDDIKCAECGAGMVYRFGKNGRFLSCVRYPDCEYACPIDEEGRPRQIVQVDVACFKCGKPMQKRSGRFGAFLGCMGYPECDGILNLDKSGRPVAPQPPPVTTELPCPKCGSPLNLRNGKRGPWLSCSAFPKCRGRSAWTKLDEAVRKGLEAELAKHLRAHPIAVIRDLKGGALTDAMGKAIDTGGGDGPVGAGTEAVGGGGAGAGEEQEAELTTDAG